MKTKTTRSTSVSSVYEKRLNSSRGSIILSRDFKKGQRSEFATRQRLQLSELLYSRNVVYDPAGQAFIYTPALAKGPLFGRLVFREPLKRPKGKFYFQFKLDSLTVKNPKIYVGLCRNDFNFEGELARQPKVWCLNLSSGDVFCDRKWRRYLDFEDPAERSRSQVRMW